MEDKNQLSDLMLDKKNTSSKNNKKMILAVATLGVILIVVVLLMNSLNSDNENNLPQSPLPPKPVVTKTQPQTQIEEPMFEDAEVIDEGNIQEDSIEKKKLEDIAKKLKAQSDTQQITKNDSSKKQQPKPKKVIHKQPVQKTVSKTAIKGKYYVQVGSFTKYSPNKKFLNSIRRAGFNYRFYKTTVHGKPITKLLIGPYPNKSEARKALNKVKRTLLKGAFIIKI